MAAIAEIAIGQEREIARQIEHEKQPKRAKRDFDFINQRSKELLNTVMASYDMTDWPEPKRWRARMHWDRLAYMQAQFEDLGHEDPIAAKARYYGLDERTMWEPPVDPPPRELPPAPPKASAPPSRPAASR